jgi:bacillithiol biosynthesis deacetylase BshB1
VTSIDLLALGPHPDDVEIACAGTILKVVRQGLSVAVVDATHGEMASRGTAADRDREAAAAAVALGLRERRNLGLPDTGVRADDGATRRLVGLLRELRPRLFLAPATRDVHPDHVATAALADRAFFLAGLRNFGRDLGAPFRPRVLLRFPGNHPVEPSLCVDITEVADRKAEVIRCYASQLGPDDRGHLLQGLDLLERAQVRDRYWGTRIGVRAAEAFWCDGPLPLSDLRSLME